MIFVILIGPAHYWDLPSLTLTFNWLEQMLDSSQMIKNFLRLMIEICKSFSKVQASKKIYNKPSPFFKKITRWRIIWETLINKNNGGILQIQEIFDHPEQILKDISLISWFLGWWANWFYLFTLITVPIYIFLTD